MIQHRAQSAPLIAYEWVKSYIIGLPADQEAFLNEATLATETGTSRTPVRDALLRLEVEGFLKRIPNKGAYVPPITDPDVRALMEARGVIERWAVHHSLNALRRSADDLQCIIDEQADAVDDVSRFIELDIDFHTRMIRLGSNPLLTEFYSSLRQRQLRVGIKAVTHGQGRGQEVLIEHQQILEAIRDGDSDAVIARIDKHLHSTLLAVTNH
ncbi:GntR family transcriptional regulator [Streptomyces sp. NPDC059816]|uniref:GntR family transcriptional regulator n=1 Tax=Streptomyces sp. NPDC059816 TaxID=3346960 RepID=UPI0036471DAF